MTLILQSPQALRPHIGIFGKRNAGKSSLMNLLTGQDLALVSPVAGTTTDPVQKSVEIPPLGPVVLIDTAGLDDEGALGELRIQKSEDVIPRVHVALLVYDHKWSDFEESLYAKLTAAKVSIVVVANKSDTASASASRQSIPHQVPHVSVSAKTGDGLGELVEAITKALPEESLTIPSLLTDILCAGEVCIFVTPIDASAPKGRLIAPQVQALRDALDTHVISLVVQPQELPAALTILKKQPALTICDTQVVDTCTIALPPSAPITTYSILMARLKGDLSTFARGAAVIDTLEDGDKVCISEVCTHHTQPDDIGKVQIPNLLAQYTGKKLNISHMSGVDYPANIKNYRLIIHCGGCMTNRPTMLVRIAKAAKAGVAITNYGIAISLMRGVLERALGVFPESFDAYNKERTFLGKR